MMRMPKLPWERLESWGISLQVIKTALAAGLSWTAAGWLFHASKPYFAPLAAILSVQATIAESLSRGLQRVAGVVAGVGLAIVFTHWIGLSPWSLALLVFVGMAVATRLRLGPQGIPQVAISGLMVMALGSTVPGYAWYRLLETILGAGIAVMVSALVWPPDLTPQAQASVKVLALGLKALLETLSQDLMGPMRRSQLERHLERARAVEGGLRQARQAIWRAETSLRWNPWHQPAKARLSGLRRGLTVLEHTLMQIRGISRTLDIAAARPSQPPGVWERVNRRLADLLVLMGAALGHYAVLIAEADGRAEAHLLRELDRAAEQRRALFHWAQGGWTHDGAALFDVAAVLADLEKMSQDLRYSSRLILPQSRLSD